MPLSLLGGTFLVVFPLLHFAQFPCDIFPRAPDIQATLTCDKTFYVCALRSLMALIFFTVLACQSTACLAVSYHGEHAHYVTTSRTHLLYFNQLRNLSRPRISASSCIHFVVILLFLRDTSFLFLVLPFSSKTCLCHWH